YSGTVRPGRAPSISERPPTEGSMRPAPPAAAGPESRAGTMTVLLVVFVALVGLVFGLVILATFGTVSSSREEDLQQAGKVCMIRLQAQVIRYCWSIESHIAPWEEPGEVLSVSDWMIEGSDEAERFRLTRTKQVEGNWDEVRVTVVDRRWIEPSELPTEV